MISASEYHVEIVDIESIQPSPENDDIYGAIEHDEQMDALIESIRRRGLEEPIIVTADDFILSGHRRYFACQALGKSEIPIRRKTTIHRLNDDDFHRLLTEYNPQRIKRTSSLLKEALLRHRDDDATVLLKDHERASVEVDVEFEHVAGFKTSQRVSPKKQEFLDAANDVIRKMYKFWPLSVRQIHYQLLNDPPLTQTPKRSTKPLEHYRYRNDKASYTALVNLLRQARYAGQVDMTVIDDATRPRIVHTGFDNVSQFIEQEVGGFLTGYHRSPQLDQPRHIEVLGEKNTLLQIMKPVCNDYYVPLSLSRGYGSIPIWRDMAKRFKQSGKAAFTLIIASDYDPEGLDLADDAVRSLRDRFGIAVDYHRIGVNREQVDELDLDADFNPAKETSSRLESFIDRTGGEETWELEALPPEYLQDQLRAAIEGNMCMDTYEESIRDMHEAAEYLAEVRENIAGDLEI